MTSSEARRHLRNLHSRVLVHASPGSVVCVGGSGVEMALSMRQELRRLLHCNKEAFSGEDGQRAFQVLLSIGNALDTPAGAATASLAMELSDALSVFAPAGHPFERNADGSWSYGTPRKLSDGSSDGSAHGTPRVEGERQGGQPPRDATPLAHAPASVGLARQFAPSAMGASVAGAKATHLVATSEGSSRRAQVSSDPHQSRAAPSGRRPVRWWLLALVALVVLLGTSAGTRIWSMLPESFKPQAAQERGPSMFPDLSPPPAAPQPASRRK